jgi:ubiquinone/menaquinone biosynthesis C-methylase UbiE
MGGRLMSEQLAMTTRSVFFGGEISQNYEDYLGPFLFEPYAVDLASRIQWTGVSQILELACGSGRLTKVISERLPPTVAFTATDLNADMISVAKNKVPSERIKWETADMLNLPFEDGSFDLVICQFGIMLVPDQQKALAEIYRVLNKGGKVMFSTWSDLAYNKLWSIGDKVLRSYLGKSSMEQIPGPFAMAAEEDVLNRLNGAGFTVMHATVVTNSGDTESAKMAAYGFIFGLPVIQLIRKEAPNSLSTILETLEESLRAELGEHPLRVPQKALVFEATK